MDFSVNLLVYYRSIVMPSGVVRFIQLHIMSDTLDGFLFGGGKTMVLFVLNLALFGLQMMSSWMWACNHVKISRWKDGNYTMKKTID